MIEVFTSNTANGQKVHIALEECGFDYKLHDVNMKGGEHQSPQFLAMNPAGKIPVMVDPDGPGGASVTLAQSMAICLYLFEKAGKLIPTDPVERARMYQFMALVSADVSAAFSGNYNFKFMDPNEGALAYYQRQAHRGLKALDARLAESPYFAGAEYTAADVIAYPVAATSIKALIPNLDDYPNLQRWAKVVGDRPAVQRGMAAGA